MNCGPLSAGHQQKVVLLVSFVNEYVTPQFVAMNNVLTNRIEGQAIGWWRVVRC